MKRISVFLNQTGIMNPLLLLLAAAGIIIVILVIQSAPFKGKEQNLAPKPPAEAASQNKGKGKPPVNPTTASPFGVLINNMDHTTSRAVIAQNMQAAKDSGATWVRTAF